MTTEAAPGDDPGKMTAEELERTTNQVLQENADALEASSAAIAIAFGLLWLCPRASFEIEPIINEAREVLREQLDIDSQERGFNAAQELAREIQSRTNSRTDPAAPAKPLERGRNSGHG